MTPASPAEALADADPAVADTPHGTALAAPNQPRTLWPAARLAIADQLWGNGFTMAGGELEILRLTRSLGLSSGSTLLLVGVGGGGPASGVIRNTGAWVTGLEVDPGLLKAAQALMKAGQFGKRATIEAWDPGHPQFGRHRYHHCLALDPLRSGDQPEPVLDELSQSLKPGGQLVMTELVAETPLPADDAVASRWARLERRRIDAIPSANGLTRMMARIGFDVRIVEDISDRHMQNAMIGWRVAVRELQEKRPDPLMAAQLVAEAEIWLLRLRLLRDKRLKMTRWHAIARAPSRVAAKADGPA